MQTDDHTGRSIDLALDMSFKNVIMAMAVGRIAAAKDLLVFGFIPLRIVIAMPARQMDSARKSCHVRFHSKAIPPSTQRVLPVVQAESSLSKKRMAAAISS